MGLIVMGIDPSLRNTGICIAELNDERDGIAKIHRLHLAKTEPPKAKTQRKSSADYQAAVEVANIIKHMIDTNGVEVTFAEIPSGTQSARASFALGIALGMIASVRPAPLEVTAREVKMNSVGIASATKDEMIEWATELYPTAPWMKQRNGNILKTNEHLADAVAIIHAGLRTAQFLSIKDFLSQRGINQR